MAASLRESVGSSVAPKMTFSRACEIAKNFPGLGKKMDVPVIREAPVGATTIMDMPMSMASTSHIKQTRYLIDIVDRVPDDYNLRNIHQALSHGQYDQLPSPFSPAAAVSTIYSMQMVIVPNEVKTAEGEETLQLIKQFIFDKPCPLETARSLSRGHAWVPNFG